MILFVFQVNKGPMTCVGIVEECYSACEEHLDKLTLTHEKNYELLWSVEVPFEDLEMRDIEQGIVFFTKEE